MALKYLDYNLQKLHDDFYLNMDDLNKIKKLLIFLTRILIMLLQK